MSGGRAPGVMETAMGMVRETGGDVGKAFYRGFGLKLLRAVPASAVAFFAYEESRRWLEEDVAAKHTYPDASPSLAAVAAAEQK